jgi:uncharacterized membrane protein YhaH (DUF805 family)
MNEIFNNYGNEFKRCFSFKGHITNKDFVLYLLMNAILMSAIASFVSGVYDGYINEYSSMRIILFSILYILTTSGIIIKKINTLLTNGN